MNIVEILVQAAIIVCMQVNTPEKEMNKCVIDLLEQTRTSIDAEIKERKK